MWRAKGREVGGYAMEVFPSWMGMVLLVAETIQGTGVFWGGIVVHFFSLFT